MKANRRTGPPPEPLAYRRDRPSDGARWVTLPAMGRTGAPPAWPLTRASRAELTMWADLWTKPQAVMWEQGHYEQTVAHYVRQVRVSEAPDARAQDRALIRQYVDMLGLSEAGLASNRWVIDEPTAHSNTPSVSRSARSAAQRFRVIEGEAAS